MYLKRLLSILTAVCLTLGIFGGTALSARAAGDSVTYVSNVVLLVDFQDTDHEKHSFLWGTCPEKDPDALVETLSGENPRSMTQFLSNISYGQLQVTNVFPQYRDGVMASYRLAYNAEHYVDDKMIGTGTEIIRELLPQLREDLKGYDLDRDGDGVVDNLTLILPCDENSRDSLFYSHKATYGGTDAVNGLRIGNYNVLTEHALNQNGSAVAIHEFLHTRGYPDLYDGTRSGTSGETGSGSSGVTKAPVWLWDIMSSTFMYVRYPLAYLRSAITKWFDIPTVMESQTGYSLYAASAADEKTRDKQAVILKTDYSDTEFFVLEYRKRGETYSNTDYDCGIPGTGLIIYRVNLSRESNYSGAPYLIYVFRPGDTYADGFEQGGGQVENSFLSAESGRTAYGSADPTATLSDGAITYSDGTNSGIVIHNVGGTDGETITFDVTFPTVPENAWKTETIEPVDESPCLAVHMADDGSMYYLLKKSDAVCLYQYTSSGLHQCSAPLPSSNTSSSYYLAQYNGSFYAAYYRSGRAQLLRLDGSGWTTVYTSPTEISEMSVASDAQGIYLAYTSPEGQNLYAVKYTGSAISLGTYAAQADHNTRITAPFIAAENGAVAVMYCDFPTDFQSSLNLVVRTYDAAGDTWKPAGTPMQNATGILLQIHNGALYLLKINSDGTAGSGSFLYEYDFSANGDWKPLGGAYTAGTVSSASLGFQGNTPTILYYGSVSGRGSQLCAVQLSEDSWVQLGTALTQSTVSGLHLSCDNDRLYASYLTDISYQFYLKSYETAPGHTHDFRTRLTRPATCGQTGLYTHTCTVCGVSRTEVIPMLPGHTFGSWTVSAVPTCTSGGSRTRVCTICDHTEMQTIPAVGHSWSASFTVDVEPAYSHPGSQSIHCTSCDAVKDSTILPAKPNPFVDVTPGAESYYYTPVLWALDREITRGVDATHFSPFDVCTRGQVVTFLWRAAGAPEPETEASPFADVQDPGAYYYKAVLWAVEHGITNGTDANHFTPDTTVTRGQFVTFLWRLSGKPDHSGRNPFGDIAPGPDSFYYDAVLWACERGITNGVGNDCFAPADPCQRGQTVTFLHRYYTAN